MGVTDFPRKYTIFTGSGMVESLLFLLLMLQVILLLLQLLLLLAAADVLDEETSNASTPVKFVLWS